MFNFEASKGLILGKAVVLMELTEKATDNNRYYLCFGGGGKLFVFKSELPEPEIKEQNEGDKLPFVFGEVTEVLADRVFMGYDTLYKCTVDFIKEQLKSIINECQEDKEFDWQGHADRQIYNLVYALGFEQIAQLYKQIKDFKD